MKDQPTPPLSCTLSSPELLNRRLTILKAIRNATTETLELSNGFALRLPVSDEWRKKLEEFIAFERQCCAFLSFEIQERPADSGLWLHVSGPDGTKEFVRTELMLVE